MFGCEIDNLLSMRIEDGIAENKKSVRASLGCGLENPVKVLDVGNVQISKKNVDRARGNYRLPQSLRVAWIVRITDDRHARYFGTDLPQESICLPPVSGARLAKPVMFPPGRARLRANPLPTGSVS